MLPPSGRRKSGEEGLHPHPATATIGGAQGIRAQPHRPNTRKEPDMETRPEIQGVDIMLVGNFNPAILTPAWFCARGILEKGAEEKAEISIIHPNACEFAFEWFIFRANNEQFQLATTEAPYARIRESVSQIFREHLPHTPLRALGINRRVHFAVENKALRDTIRKSLAPPKIWSRQAEKADTGTGGFEMKSLTMTQYYQDKGHRTENITNVIVEPSNKIEERGIYMTINNHYRTREQEKSPLILIDALEREFDEALRRGGEIIDQVASLQETQGA